MSTNTIRWADVNPAAGVRLEHMGLPCLGVTDMRLPDLDRRSAVQYVPDDFILAVADRPLGWQRKGLQYTATGYGDKIPSRTVIQCADRRWRRVYIAIFSNAGSAYLLINCQRIYLHDYQLDQVKG